MAVQSQCPGVLDQQAGTDTPEYTNEASQLSYKPCITGSNYYVVHGATCNENSDHVRVNSDNRRTTELTTLTGQV